MNKFATLLIAPFMGVLLSACQINQCYTSSKEEKKTTLINEPKRASTTYDWLTCWLDAEDGYYFVGNTDEGFPIQSQEGRNKGTIVCSDQSSNDSFTLQDAQHVSYNFDVYVSNETLQSSSEITSITDWNLYAYNVHSYSWYRYASTGFGYPWVKITLTTPLGSITIHNEKEDGEGPISVVNSDLETLVSISEGNQGTLDREAILDDTLTLITDSVLCDIGTTNGGSDVATNIRNYTITLATPLEIYVTSTQPKFKIVNNTAWDMSYYRYAIFDIDENSSAYNLPRYETTISYTLNQPITIISDYPFQVSENGQAPQLATYLQNISGEMWSGIEGYYGYQFPSTATEANDVITISSTAGEADEILWSTFQTIGNALTALVPILSISVFGQITIGSILLIPFTFTLIVLIFRMIKK